MGANLGLKPKYLGGLFILMKKNSWAAQKMFARAEKESKTSKLNLFCASGGPAGRVYGTLIEFSGV